MATERTNKRDRQEMAEVEEGEGEGGRSSTSVSA